MPFMSVLSVSDRSEPRDSRGLLLLLLLLVAAGAGMATRGDNRCSAAAFWAFALTTCENFRSCMMTCARMPRAPIRGTRYNGGWVVTLYVLGPSPRSYTRVPLVALRIRGSGDCHS